jgi:hypothetical protein
MTHGLSPIRVAATLVLATVLVFAGCAPGEPSPEEKAVVEQAVRNYLEALAASYSSLDLSHLEGHASPVEVRNVRNLLQQLANTGDRVESTLLGLEVTGLDIFRDVNASVALVEIWEVVRFDALTGEEKGRRPNSVQNTLIQLRKIDGEWLVIGRHIVERDPPAANDLEETGG